MIARDYYGWLYAAPLAGLTAGFFYRGELIRRENVALALFEIPLRRTQNAEALAAIIVVTKRSLGVDIKAHMKQSGNKP